MISLETIRVVDAELRKLGDDRTIRHCRQVVLALVGAKYNPDHLMPEIEWGQPDIVGRPWHVQRSSHTDGRVIVRRSDGVWVCDFDGENAMAFAELIVCAVNAQGQVGRQFEVEEGEILATIAAKYRGDHNIETLFVILTRVAFERLQLLQALKELIEASGNMAPVGGEARYQTAVERAETAIAKVRV